MAMLNNQRVAYSKKYESYMHIYFSYIYKNMKCWIILISTYSTFEKKIME